MASRAQPARPVLAVAGSLVAAAVALRGYVPDAPRPDPARPADSPLSTVLVIGLLVVALAVVAVAVVTRARQPRVGRGPVANRPDWLRGDLGRPSWRMVLTALAVLAVAVCAALLLSGLGDDTAPYSPARAPSDADANSARSGADDAPARPPEPRHDDLIGYLAGATALFLAVLTVGSVAVARRRSDPAPGAPAEGAPACAPVRGTHVLARAAEVGLAEVEDHDRDPRAAIIACYVAMERALARVPEATPEECDTASEVLARAVDRRVLGPEGARRLVDLFEEARFSPHVMTEAHRDVAAGVLQDVLDELRAHA